MQAIKRGIATAPSLPQEGILRRTRFFVGAEVPPRCAWARLKRRLTIEQLRHRLPREFWSRRPEPSSRRRQTRIPAKV